MNVVSRIPESSYRTWHIPYAQDRITLRQAHQDLQRLGADQQEIPLLVQLVENPKYRIPGLALFHGAVDLTQHDYIHIALGRGLLSKDEAFTIGFTMGSTKKVHTLEEMLFAAVSRYLYPRIYQFDADDIAVFKDALRLAYLCDCAALDSWDFTPHLDQPLHQLRAALGLDDALMLAYYALEQRRYPKAPESLRLLDC